MKKIKINLLWKVFIAILAGVLLGNFMPFGLTRVFVTFNSIFGNFLSFSIPLIIVGLVVPALLFFLVFSPISAASLYSRTC